MVKHADAAELRVVVAAVLAVAADAVLVAQHLLKLGAHLVTALARLHVSNQPCSIEFYSAPLVLYSHAHNFLKKPTRISQFLLSFFVLF